MTVTLEVRNLRTHFFTRAGVVKAVDDVSFAVSRGQVLGLVGESGSGKSVTGFSVIGLVDPPGRVAGGQILYQGQDLAKLSEGEMRSLRGNRIAWTQSNARTPNLTFAYEVPGAGQPVVV